MVPTTSSHVRVYSHCPSTVIPSCIPTNFFMMIVLFCEVFYSFFFFQAEDGIRDTSVTGVQTCALPISRKGSAGCALAGRPALPCAWSPLEPFLALAPPASHRRAWPSTGRLRSPAWATGPRACPRVHGESLRARTRPLASTLTCLARRLDGHVRWFPCRAYQYTSDDQARQSSARLQREMTTPRDLRFRPDVLRRARARLALLGRRFDLLVGHRPDVTIRGIRPLRVEAQPFHVRRGLLAPRIEDFFGVVLPRLFDGPHSSHDVVHEVERE